MARELHDFPQFTVCVELAWLLRGLKKRVVGCSMVIRGEPDPDSASIDDWVAYREHLRSLPGQDESIRVAPRSGAGADSETAAIRLGPIGTALPEDADSACQVTRPLGVGRELFELAP